MSRGVGLFNPLGVTKILAKYQLISIHESCVTTIKIFFNLGKFGPNIKTICKNRKTSNYSYLDNTLMAIFVLLS